VACGTQGGVLATLPQLSAAQQVRGAQELEPSLQGSLESGLTSEYLLLLLQLGFHLCLVGWLANGSAAHPVVFPAADCGDGRVGVVSLGVRKNLSEHWDAYCYRVQGVCTPPCPTSCSVPFSPTH
jgi:stabilin-1